jgi:hexokinase
VQLLIPKQKKKYKLLFIHPPFAFSQTSFSQGTMLRMGKGFILDGYEGQDLADLFHRAFERKVE